MPQSPANEDLSAYLDGELPPEASARVERALSGDPRLQAELEQLRAVRAILSRHGRVEAPFGFKAKVLAAVAEEPAPIATWKSWLRRPFGLPIEGLAVALAALLVILVVGSREQSATNEPSNNFGAPTPAGDQVIVNPERDAARAQQRPDPVGGAAPSQLDPANEGEASEGTPSVRGQRLEGVSTSTPMLETIPTAAPQPVPFGGGTPLPSPEPAAEPSGTADDDAPALFGASYRYQVSTSDPDAAVQLRRLAGRYRGRVSAGGTGQATASQPQADGGSYRVQVPAEHLAEFGAALRTLGVVVERPDDRIFASSSVTIQVDLVVVDPDPTAKEQ